MNTKSIIYKLSMKTNLLLLTLAYLLITNSCSKSNQAAPAGNPPVVHSIVITTTNIVDITATSMHCGGSITSDGGSPITLKGFCWSTSPNPTTANSTSQDGTGTGFYFRKITGLSLATTYYIRAFATNILGTVYGNQLSITTAVAIVPPLAITTDLISSILSSTAVCGGYIGLDGGAPVTARGLCWNTSPGPTIANSKTVEGTGEGDFTSTLIGLNENIVYYARAYGTNSAGTAYGNEVTFKTLEAGTVFIGCSNNKFYALDALTGQKKWEYTGQSSFSFVDPCYANGKIYTGGGVDGYFYCLNATNGNLIWSYQIGIGVASPPVYDNGIIYFGGVDDYLYALDANTGSLKWRYLTGGNVSSSPVLNNNVVYFGSDDKKLYALDASSGTFIWSYETGALINTSGAALVNGILYIGSRDGFLYAINSNNGSLAWKYNTNGISLERSSPTVVNNIVYVGSYGNYSGSPGGGLYAINAITGQLVWEEFQNTGFISSPVVDNGVVYITTVNGDLLGVNALLGYQTLRKTTFSNGSSPVVMNGHIYIGGGGTNKIYAINIATGAEKWVFPLTNSPLTSAPCVVTSTSVKHSGASGMQQ